MCTKTCVYNINKLLFSHPDSSTDSYLSLTTEPNDGESNTEVDRDKEVKTEDFVSTLGVEQKWVDAYTQKNISFEGKPVTPTSTSGGFAEVFSLRDQLKQAEEKASRVQREVQHIYRYINRSERPFVSFLSFLRFNCENFFNIDHVVKD